MCPIIFNSNIIKLTMYTSCYCLELTVLLFQNGFHFSLNTVKIRTPGNQNLDSSRSVFSVQFLTFFPLFYDVSRPNEFGTQGSGMRLIRETLVWFSSNILKSEPLCPDFKWPSEFQTFNKLYTLLPLKYFTWSLFRSWL